MRPLMLLIAVAFAAPAAAQVYPGAMVNGVDPEAARRRDIEITNQLSVMDAQIRSEQTMRDLQATSQRPVLPNPDPDVPPVVIDTSKLTSIPDKDLADSNARVRAAAANRR